MSLSKMNEINDKINDITRQSPHFKFQPLKQINQMYLNAFVASAYIMFIGWKGSL